MTFLEALNSGKPFKRPDWNSYSSIKNGYIVETGATSDYVHSLSGLSRNDWEVKPDTMEVEVIMVDGKVIDWYYPGAPDSSSEVYKGSGYTKVLLREVSRCRE